MQIRCKLILIVVSIVVVVVLSYLNNGGHF